MHLLQKCKRNTWVAHEKDGWRKTNLDVQGIWKRKVHCNNHIYIYICEHYIYIYIIYKSIGWSAWDSNKRYTNENSTEIAYISLFFSRSIASTRVWRLSSSYTSIEIAQLIAVFIHMRTDFIIFDADILKYLAF